MTLKKYREALLRWQSLQVQRSIDPDTDFVFRGKMGGALPTHSWRRHFDKLVAETGVRRLTLHELRHTSATLEMQSGAHGKVVSERLGHKDPAFTMRIYQHLTPDLQRSAADALDSSIFGEDEDDLPPQLPRVKAKP